MLTISINILIWIIVTLNQLFIRGSYNPNKFLKNEVVSEKSSFIFIVPFCTPHSICLNTSF